MVAFREVFDLRSYKMGGDPGNLGEKAAIAHQSQSLNLLVMALDKPHVSENRFEIHPAREGFRVDHHPTQFAMFRDVWIDLMGQAHKIGRFERSLGFENEDPFWRK